MTLLQRRPDLGIGGLIFCGLSLVYFALQRGTTPTYDAGIYIDVANNLYSHLSVRVRHDPYLINTPYASYGLGLSLAIIPLVALQEAARPGGQGFLLLANIFIVAGTAVLVYLLATALALPRISAVGAALVFGLTTMAVQQSTDLFSEPGVALFVLLSVFGLVKWRARSAFGPWLVGLGIGLAISFRGDSIVMSSIVLLAVPWFVPLTTLRASMRKWIPGVLLPVAVAMTYQLAYNQFRFGRFSQFGYPGQGFTAPFMTGFYGNTFSPGKGFFVYNVFLLLAIPGLAIMWRRDRAFALAILLLAVVRPFFYARWFSWAGGVGWGPRFLFPLCALLAIPAVVTVQTIAASRSRFRLVGLLGAAALFATGAFIAFLSVAVPFEQWYFIASGDAVIQQTPERSAQRLHDYLWSFHGNHVAGNVRLLDEANPFPLKWFSGDRIRLGIASLAFGLVLLVTAIVAARRADRAARIADPQGVADPVNVEHSPARS